MVCRILTCSEAGGDDAGNDSQYQNQQSGNSGKKIMDKSDAFLPAGAHWDDMTVLAACIWKKGIE